MTSTDPSWTIKRRHEDLSQVFRTSWDLYIKFYTVFLTASVGGLAWILVRTSDAALSASTIGVVASVFGTCQRQ